MAGKEPLTMEIAEVVSDVPLPPVHELKLASAKPCLGVVIPVYNEVNTVDAILKRVLSQPSVAEVLVVDDCSTDGTLERLKRWPSTDDRVRLIFHQGNQGKGAAVRSGLRQSTAPVVIVQDADLEYDPADYASMLKEIFSGNADVVYGSRFANNERRRNALWHTLGNRVLTTIGNLATGFRLTDSATCYKMFRRDVLARIQLEEDRFGFCPEVTAKVAKLRVRLVEVPISYSARGVAQGKKIRLRDGLDALRCIIRYNWFR
jgi:glycosyltransferase involved in cell wall biosynthesis